jgi:UDP-N-acetyl-D-mannosaminuronic acid dehydrogenase
MKMLFEDILPYLKNEQIIIMRSTVYPGTTEKVRSMLKDKLPNIEVCFCPERILEGKSMEELYNLPQIVSGFNEKAIKEVSALFNLLTKDILIVKPMEAELAKVFTNTWRYIQFATANQFYMIAEEAGVDFYKVYNAMTFNYPRAKGFPRPGFAAGPCLFKDTMQTSAFAKNTFFLGHSAMLINEGLPNFVVSQLKEKHDLTKKTVGILGMAFKSESDDKRESLSYKLKKILEIEAKKVFCSDVYIKEEGFVDEKSLIEKSDIIIIGAPHKKYKKLEYQGKKIIDVWNMIE